MSERRHRDSQRDPPYPYSTPHRQPSQHYVPSPSPSYIQPRRRVSHASGLEEPPKFTNPFTGEPLSTPDGPLPTYPPTRRAQDHGSYIPWSPPPPQHPPPPQQLTSQSRAPSFPPARERAYVPLAGGAEPAYPPRGWDHNHGHIDSIQQPKLPPIQHTGVHVLPPPLSLHLSELQERATGSYDSSGCSAGYKQRSPTYSQALDAAWPKGQQEAETDSVRGDMSAGIPLVAPSYIYYPPEAPYSSQSVSGINEPLYGSTAWKFRRQVEIRALPRPPRDMSPSPPMPPPPSPSPSPELVLSSYSGRSTPTYSYIHGSAAAHAPGTTARSQGSGGFYC